MTQSGFSLPFTEKRPYEIYVLQQRWWHNYEEGKYVIAYGLSSL
jgi:hypothetical protein